MSEAVFGFIGVLIGSLVPWVQTSWRERQARVKHARYLAIRVVCILDEFVEKCAEVVSDNGLYRGQRNMEEYLEVQVALPPSPQYPEDVNWQSIDHALMYRLLSFPRKCDAANRIIEAAGEIADPPDYEEAFDERRDQYSALGLAALGLAQEIRRAYNIPPHALRSWDPAETLRAAKSRIADGRQPNQIVT